MTDKTSLIGEIVALHRRVNRALRQRAPDPWMNLNLTIGQVKSLFFITNQGSTTSRRLAVALKVTPSNVTGIVDRLVQQGLVSRQENPEDRRALLLRATEEGEAIVADLRERRASYLTELLSRLSAEELATIARGLALLANAVEVSEEGAEDERNRG